MRRAERLRGRYFVFCYFFKTIFGEDDNTKRKARKAEEKEDEAKEDVKKERLTLPVQ